MMNLHVDQQQITCYGKRPVVSLNKVDPEKDIGQVKYS